jgi:predicted Zn finger-like uncharacterized protein
MLIVCPSCNSRYVVPDNAIGVDGRSVRCANCRHSWFQHGTPLEPVKPEPIAPAPHVAAPKTVDEIPAAAASAPAASMPATPLAPPPPPVAPTPASPSIEPAAKPVQTGFAAFDNPPQPAQTPSFAETPPPPPHHVPESPQASQFAHEPPFKPRRNPAKLWTIAAVAFAVSIVALGGAVSYFGLPGDSFTSSFLEPDLKIEMTPNLELQYRTDGTSFFIASGTIINPTGREQKIPNIQVTLKDASKRPVYSWVIKPKKRNIGPGERIDFSEAKLDVPRSASNISVGWMQDRN